MLTAETRWQKEAHTGSGEAQPSIEKRPREPEWRADSSANRCYIEEPLTDPMQWFKELFGGLKDKGGLLWLLIVLAAVLVFGVAVLIGYFFALPKPYAT